MKGARGPGFNSQLSPALHSSLTMSTGPKELKRMPQKYSTGSLLDFRVVYCLNREVYEMTISQNMQAWLAQSVEHETLNLRVMGSSPMSGDMIYLKIVDTHLVRTLWRFQIVDIALNVGSMV